jgi:hypothetical protein
MKYKEGDIVFLNSYYGSIEKNMNIILSIQYNEYLEKQLYELSNFSFNYVDKGYLDRNFIKIYDKKSNKVISKNIKKIKNIYNKEVDRMLIWNINNKGV